jgi:ABC-2 type transport system permease protein
MSATTGITTSTVTRENARVAARGGLRHELSLVAWQVRYEQRGFWRNRRRALASFAFPLMFLLIFGSLDGGAHLKERGNLPYIDFYVPGIIAYAVMVIGFSNMAMSIANLRETGIIKRMRSTPMPWSSYLAGITFSSVLTVFAAIVVLLAVGIVLMGARVFTATLPGLAVTVILGTACFTTLGIAISRLIPNPESGMPILMFVTLPITFVSEVFFPLEGAPSWLKQVADVFPLRPLSNALQAAFDPRTHGAGLVGHDLRSLAIWTIVGCFLMVRTMRSLSARD